MLYLLHYDTAGAGADRVREAYPRHRAHLDEFARGGRLLAIGALRPAPGSGALAVFRTREAAEAFAASDPFVLEGLAVPRPVQEWDALEYAP